MKPYYRGEGWRAGDGDELNGSFDITSRPEELIAAANPSFTNGVATKDIHIETSTSLALCIFLPETCLVSTDPRSKARVTTK
ncbi:hypothetical protein Ccrd_010949 [Cynara cardunculus var. scolymus]|uniref:Uncharacterized protein n=1 Tax=Cynara cardunculus var. scolymus TaxID=59895 RepID=A0A118K6G1_CYNCS|nr:hypothetical protein Ccrd_010949 [Cynara cardunculus var. scolymus]